MPGLNHEKREGFSINRWTALPVLLLAVVGAPATLIGAETGDAAIFDLQAHRGGRALWPENTLVSFSGALALGVSTLELDCAVTKDGVVVVSHDSALNPDITRDARGEFLSATGPANRRRAVAQGLASNTSAPDRDSDRTPSALSRRRRL